LIYELDELLSKALDLEEYVLIAHSLEPLEALRCARRYPEKVSAIIL